MSLRHIVYGLLGASAGLTGMIGNRRFDAAALGTPTGKDIPQLPFLVTNYGSEEIGPAEDCRVEVRTVDVYFYGKAGDFTEVEKGLSYVKTALHRVSTFYEDPESGDRTYLTQSEYRGSSPDLYDDVYRAPFRYATYRLIGNKS